MAHGLVSTGVSFPDGTTQTTVFISTTGYMKTPSGILFQWGSVGAGTITVTFPVAFSAAPRCVGVGNTSSRAWTRINGTPSTTSFVLDNSQVNIPKYWMAVGY